MTTSTRRPFGFVPKAVPYYAKQPEPAQHIPRLELRTCICGCQRKFKVPEGSTAIFASRQCNPPTKETGNAGT